VRRETEMLATIEAAADHLDPEDLADRMVAGEAGLVVVDVRPESEFHAGHLRGAVNIPLPRLVDELTPVKNRGTIVLYSNGMTHPAQARDALARLGFTNVFLLTDGLDGFFARCLKPVSLRREPLAPADAARITRWRQYFLAGSGPHPPATPATITPASTSGISALPADQGARVAAAPVWPTSLAPVIHLPGLVEPDWLTANLGKPGLCIVDLRAQPEYNAGHAPGAVSLHIESLRGMVGGVPSMLLPADMLARQVGQLGVNTTDVVVFVHGDKVHDATLAGLALERLGHRYWGVLHGGHSRWETEKRPLTRQLPRVTATSYPVPTEPDRFTVGIDVVAKAAADRSALIVDVRPAEFFTGAKSDEARAGHIPGARSRPHLDDLDKQGEVARFKTIADLTAVWQQIGVRPLAQPERAPGTAAALEKPVILHCRTGHQASQAYFVLKYLLGYRDVSWYDGGWTEWASRSDLPSEATP